MPHAQAAAPRLCSDGECLDEALLVGLGQRLAALPAERRARGLVLVLHQMGSHGPAYHRRSPAARKPFLPECTTHALQDCRRDALINAYDNSIAYTDHVLGQAIGWLDAQRDSFAPMLIWLPSSAAGSRTAALDACLREQRDRPLSHDHLFHTVLGLLGLEAGVYRTTLDLSAPCRSV